MEPEEPTGTVCPLVTARTKQRRPGRAGWAGFRHPAPGPTLRADPPGGKRMGANHQVGVGGRREPVLDDL